MTIICNFFLCIRLHTTNKSIIFRFLSSFLLYLILIFHILFSFKWLSLIFFFIKFSLQFWLFDVITFCRTYPIPILKFYCKSNWSSIMLIKCFLCSMFFSNPSSKLRLNMMCRVKMGRSTKKHNPRKWTDKIHWKNMFDRSVQRVERIQSKKKLKWNAAHFSKCFGLTLLIRKKSERTIQINKNHVGKIKKE